MRFGVVLCLGILLSAARVNGDDKVVVVGDHKPASTPQQHQQSQSSGFDWQQYVGGQGGGQGGYNWQQYVGGGQAAQGGKGGQGGVFNWQQYVGAGGQGSGGGYDWQQFVPSQSDSTNAGQVTALSHYARWRQAAEEYSAEAANAMDPVKFEQFMQASTSPSHAGIQRFLDWLNKQEKEVRKVIEESKDGDKKASQPDTEDVSAAALKDSEKLEGSEVDEPEKVSTMAAPKAWKFSTAAFLGFSMLLGMMAYAFHVHTKEKDAANRSDYEPINVTV
jgi:hypothetical protein